MTLAEFKAARGLSLTELASLLGRGSSTVHGWLTERRRPDWEAVADIEAATGGAVTAADFVPRRALATPTPEAA
ncbi:helix-turn-helix domain-containing protein [Roseomonas mucosa]|uniref:helix-turn-helix domain-containing protein n=1 Tax=Roseomonas mucosa TaxID=207340 RepID=UPI00384F601D